LVVGSLRDVQALAGHASLSTTNRYIEMDAEAQSRFKKVESRHWRPRPTTAPTCAAPEKQLIDAFTLWLLIPSRRKQGPLARRRCCFSEPLSSGSVCEALSIKVSQTSLGSVLALMNWERLKLLPHCTPSSRRFRLLHSPNLAPYTNGSLSSPSRPAVIEVSITNSSLSSDGAAMAAFPFSNSIGFNLLRTNNA
jgi:hypothetical protein